MSIDKLIEELRAAYAKVAAWPESRMTPDAVEHLGEGFIDLLKLRNLAPETISVLASTQAEILRLKTALAPFAAMAAASDKLAVEGQRRLQPKESAELTDAEIAILVIPDDQVVMTDGRMAFGHDQHPSKPARVTMGDLRRAALSLDGEEGA